MIVAVTGAQGFTGQHVCRGLADAGHEVRAIARRDFEAGKLADRMGNADVVIPLAAATRAPTRAELRESNVRLTERVVEAAEAAGARRMVFMSSQAAAG